MILGDEPCTVSYLSSSRFDVPNIKEGKTLPAISKAKPVPFHRFIKEGPSLSTQRYSRSSLSIPKGICSTSLINKISTATLFTAQTAMSSNLIERFLPFKMFSYTKYLRVMLIYHLRIFCPYSDLVFFLPGGSGPYWHREEASRGRRRCEEGR